MLTHLPHLGTEKILVIGDLMLDCYTIGKASRISPEAPVPILLVKDERSLPGGAGNVALNLLSLGQEVVLIGRFGDDLAGKYLLKALIDSNISTDSIFLEPGYKTPVKNRIIADNQQMIRIDHEINSALTEEVEARIISSLPKLLEDVSAVAISDYGKGFLTRNLLKAVIKEARSRGIVVAADPKGADFTKYEGAFVLKPNLKEAYAAANLTEESTLEQVASALLHGAQVDNLMITRSENGISLFDHLKRQDFPVKVKEVKDVTGAGDTVLATLTACLASKMTLTQAAELSNVAASLAIEHVGCARITLADMTARLLEDHAPDKLVDAVNAQALHYALQNREHSIIELHDESTLDPALYQQIQALKVHANHTLVMKLPPTPSSTSFVSMLASLKEVDFIVLS